MSTTKYYPNGPNTKPVYDIGTIGFEHRNIISKGIDIFANYIIKDFTKSALLMGAVSSLLDRDGSAVMPTYGYWAGPGWAGRRDDPVIEGCAKPIESRVNKYLTII